MRSTETSGVEVNGFGLRQGSLPILTRLARTLAAAAGMVVERMSPITLAVALTALVAASVYVISDAARTAAEAEALQRDMMRVAIAQPVAMWEFPGRTMTTLAGPDADATYAALINRGVGAFTLAFVAIGLTLVRRPPASPRQLKARDYQALLATLPFGAACWTAEGRLIACNA